MSSDYHELVKGNILIVDDVPENVRLLSAMFCQADYEIKSVADLNLALALALESTKTNSFDAVLVDLDSIGVKAYEVCSQLKAGAETKDMAVIFLGFSQNFAEKLRGFEVGGADYIHKPFQASELVARVKSQVEQSWVRKRLEAENKLLREEILIHLETEVALREANYKLESLNKIDGLTMLSNRSYFDKYLEGSWRQIQRETTCMSLLICDIDLFYLYNEAYGNDQGNNCLQKIAQTAAKVVKRPADLAARYGEDEFSILLPKTDASGAITVAKHLQRELKSMAIPHSQAPSGYLTVSIGVSTVFTVESKQQMEQQILVDTAEQALYQAKQEGRDRIIFKIVDSQVSIAL